MRVYPNESRYQKVANNQKLWARKWILIKIRLVTLVSPLPELVSFSPEQKSLSQILNLSSAFLKLSFIKYNIDHGKKSIFIRSIFDGFVMILLWFYYWGIRHHLSSMCICYFSSNVIGFMFRGFSLVLNYWETAELPIRAPLSSKIPAY